MNEFEKQINALRLQYRDERMQIAKDCRRAIGHLNTAIGMVKSPEARAALRAEKQRVYEAQRQSMKYNKLCYMQQLDALEDEYQRHLDKNPSKRQLRRMVKAICNAIEAGGANSYTVTLGDNRRATISFG